MSNDPTSRYSTVRDYILLIGGGVLIMASVGVGIIVADVQLAVAFLGGGLTCWGVVPTLQRDRSDK